MRQGSGSGPALSCLCQWCQRHQQGLGMAATAADTSLWSHSVEHLAGLPVSLHAWTQARYCLHFPLFPLPLGIPTPQGVCVFRLLLARAQDQLTPKCHLPKTREGKLDRRRRWGRWKTQGLSAVWPLEWVQVFASSGRWGVGRAVSWPWSLRGLSTMKSR